MRDDNGYLIITRMPGQRIYIKTPEGKIELEYLEQRGPKTVALGIEAPKSRRIRRIDLPKKFEEIK